MDTRDVSLFLAIARIGSVSRTAEQLFMSQSTVTTRLQRLEQNLGYPLFHRLPTGVRLTAEGQRFLPMAEQIMAIEQRMTGLNDDVVPTLRVMSGRAFVSTDIPQCLTRLVAKSKVHLDVRMGLYDEMTDALLANQVDFCFLGEPIYHPHIHQIEFTPDFIDLVVPANHHFVHHFPGLTALRQEPFIAFSRSTAPFRRRVLNLLARDNIYPDIQMELDSIDGIKAMVGHGLGVSFLPRRTLHDAQIKGYAVIPVNDVAWMRPTLLAHPADIADTTLTRRFIQVVQAYYAELG